MFCQQNEAQGKGDMSWHVLWSHMYGDLKSVLIEDGFELVEVERVKDKAVLNTLWQAGMW